MHYETQPYEDYKASTLAPSPNLRVSEPTPGSNEDRESGESEIVI